MIRIFWKYLKLGIVLFIFLSSAFTLYIHWKGGPYDPLGEIQRLKDQNRRDDALDMVKFCRENQDDKNQRLKELEEDLSYTAAEKMKSLVWDGAIKGEVKDAYSGLGAISSDLCIIGDLRDLGIQSWKYFTNNEDFDGLIMLLSGAGVGLSSTGLANGCNALAKSALKFSKKIPGVSNKGVLKKLLARKITYQESEKIWNLLKKTSGQYPEPQPVYRVLVTQNT